MSTIGKEARSAWHSFVNAFVTTAFFRCWHILLFFGAWSTAICLISNYLVDLGIQSTLLTVLGTVLGFVISYRTTSSFERYNEGRRYWSQIVLAARTLARLVWFHVPTTMKLPDVHPDEVEARVLIEKKTAINLIEAFSVAVKHYLRGEEGIDYADLYHLVKYLPSYPLPAGMPSQADLHTAPNSPTSDGNGLHKRRGQPTNPTQFDGHDRKSGGAGRRGSILDEPIYASQSSQDASHLPLPATSPGARLSLDKFDRAAVPVEKTVSRENRSDTVADSKTSIHLVPPPSPARVRLQKSIETLKPAYFPPGFGWSDFFPSFLSKHHGTIPQGAHHGKRGAKQHAKSALTHNLPLEISLYLSSYVTALQTRQAIDGPTISSLMASIQQLIDALTGLERVQTTPIPFSYSFHIWIVTLVYCFFLPFQLWTSLRWVTIPGTTIAAFMFFGFILAAEEIENPFGYDKNDLDMDNFTYNIIRPELRAITAAPAPDPSNWAFSDRNDACFAPDAGFDLVDKGVQHQSHERDTPQQWIARGKADMLRALKQGTM
ncbi:UPF0187-domain-containing protein [Peniophora sp. CONT]|nr:UPF0187-domain-containing protein [Peniophora sp. CONT]